MEEIQLIKLVTGEELVAVVLEETKRYLTIDSPMIISEAIDPESQLTSVILSRYIVFDEIQIMDIKKEHIISKVSCFEELKLYYAYSIELNNKIIVPKLKSGLTLINQEMKNYLHEKEAMAATISNSGNNIIYLKSSNTVH